MDSARHISSVLPIWGSTEVSILTSILFLLRY
nr:MAG TPA: hypothetical protein [Herelleviridae sp. ctUqP11]DAK82154.1 MAG TPA: hypothetical protein [Caudoviricetes sp.]